MKLSPKFYERATIGSVWTVLALLLLGNNLLIYSVYALFLIIAMLRFRE